RMESLLDFAVMIKDPQATTPIYPLAVVHDDGASKDKILHTGKMMEQAVMHAAATESAVQVVTRVDLNVADGIARAVKELLITNVILGWTERSSTTDRLFGTIFGTTLDNILQGVWETVYVCAFHQPLNVAKRLVLVLPHNACYEAGFPHYMQKAVVLSKQAGARLVICCTPETRARVESWLHSTRTSLPVLYRAFGEAEDLLVLAREIADDDLLLIVTARKGTLSYNKYLDNLPARLSRNFKRNNIILLYPEQAALDYNEPGLRPEDLTLAPIQEQLANLGRLGRKVRGVFKRRNKQ
ncbi:MAG TPA: cation:proton antiporter, partial [Chitinophaga sp.]